METKKVNIYLEANPNPNSLKFVADYMLVEPGTNYDFPDAASTAMHRLRKNFLNTAMCVGCFI